jgi:hypothetical protein
MISKLRRYPIAAILGASCIALIFSMISSRPAFGQDGHGQTPSQRLDNLHLFTVPTGGIDHLYFEVNDTIEVPGLGEETVTLDGTYRIQRSQPSTPDWETSNIDVKMLDLDVQGTSKLFGRIQVRLNPTRETIGKVQGSGKPKRPKPCSFKAYIQMTLLDRNMTLINKEPVALEHLITHIPPIGQGGGNPEGTYYYLYNVKDLDGPPVAVLKRIRTHIGPWVE